MIYDPTEEQLTIFKQSKPYLSYNKSSYTLIGL